MIDQTVPVDKLRDLLDGEGSAEDKIQAIYDDFLPPVLLDPMFLAKATHPQYGEGTVISHFPDRNGCVRFVFPAGEKTGDGTEYLWVSPSNLTFRTPETPDHPEVLITEEDYRNAPAGTVVAADGEGAWTWTKNKDGLWEAYGIVGVFSNFAMSGENCRVLRWGWEA